jgi:hypothetical protein
MIEILLQLIAVEKYIQSSIIYDRWVLQDGKWVN